ncbi:MFS transporter [Streptomyces nigrescens]|uniref:MFS transporter n=1 Tax=Streptomyces nigrescens TaxID=1920 RepID=UPI00347507D1
MLTGARSFAAIGQWARSAPQDALTPLGVDFPHAAQVAKIVRSQWTIENPAPLRPRHHLHQGRFQGPYRPRPGQHGHTPQLHDQPDASGGPHEHRGRPCSLLIWLDNTVLSTTLETLADPVRGLDASPAELQWATGSYTLAFATLMFTAGALGDRFGHRTVLATGLVIFAGSSVGPVAAAWGRVSLAGTGGEVSLVRRQAGRELLRR